MAKQGPVLHFGEGLDGEGKFRLHAGSHFHATRIVVGQYAKWRRTQRFLLSLVSDGLGDYVNAGKCLRMDAVEVYRSTKRVAY